MIKKVTVVGYNSENAYFYIDDKTNHGFLIDPGFEADKLLKVVEENKWVIEAILITHGHFDHIGAIEEIREVLKCKVYAGEKAYLYLENPRYNLGYYYEKEIIISDYITLAEGEKVCLEANQDLYLKLMETPGHTADSVIYFNEKENIAFVGDTIFKGTHGRTDLPGSSEEAMQESLRKIFKLDKNMILYPGHSEETTVGEEI
ncbi:MAG: MBL fold metallo-hydrolase [Clostridia bacterium]|nr:MBL fold metallo-hydrolase [Clostridia bacterium]